MPQSNKLRVRSSVSNPSRRTGPPAGKSKKVSEAAKPSPSTKGGKSEKGVKHKNVEAQLSVQRAKKSLADELKRKVQQEAPLTPLGQKWQNLFKKSAKLEPKPYTMKEVYEEKTPIMHKVLGWGYVLSKSNDRLEVLFKDGIKVLISNYKS